MLKTILKVSSKEQPQEHQQGNTNENQNKGFIQFKEYHLYSSA